MLADNAVSEAKGSSKSLTRSLFLAAFLVLWMLSARQGPAGDATAMVSVARGIVTEGRLDSSYPMLGYTVESPDGRYFSKYPLPWSLVEVPGQALERMISTAALPRPQQEVALRLVRGLTPAVFGSLSVVLLFLAMVQAGVPRRRAMMLSVLAHGTTCLLPYLNSHYSEVFQAAMVNAAVWSLAILVRVPTGRNAVRLGLFLGILVLTKVSMIPLAAIFAVAAMFILWRDCAAASRAILAMFCAMLPPVAVMIAWNVVRLGQPLMTDYGWFLVPQTLGFPSASTLFALLLSPGRGLVWFAPLLWLAWPGARRAWRELDWLGLACAFGFAATLLLHAGYTGWHGSEQWGPRYLVPMVGPLAILVAMALHRDEPSRRFRRNALVLLAIAGFAINLPGMLIRYSDFFNAVPYRPYSMIHLDAGNKPLESPELDQVYRTNYLPWFSPIPGHAWMLEHAIFGGALEDDCPWAGHVTEGPLIRTPGLAPRIDLWFVPDDNWDESTVTTVLALLAVMMLAGAGAAFGSIPPAESPRSSPASTPRPSSRSRDPENGIP